MENKVEKEEKKEIKTEDKEEVQKDNDADPFDEMHVESSEEKKEEEALEAKKKIRRPTTHLIFHPDGSTDIVEGPPSTATEEDEIFIIKRSITPLVAVTKKKLERDPLQTLMEKNPYIYCDGKLGRINEVGVRYGIENLVLEKKFLNSKNRIWMQLKCAEKYVCVKKPVEGSEEEFVCEFSENGMFDCEPSEIKKIFAIEALLTYAMPSHRYKKRQIKDDDNLLIVDKGIYPHKGINKIVDVDSDKMFLLGDEVFFKISL